jgi:hypothetical protein
VVEVVIMKKRYKKTVFGKLKDGQGFWWIEKSCGDPVVEMHKKGKKAIWADGCTDVECPRFKQNEEVWIENT